MGKDLISSGFKYRSTAEDVTKGVDASGLTAIVTGATSGIGTETVRVLALRGAHVYIAGRSVESATKTKEAIQQEIPDAKLDVLAPLDLGSQTSIRKSAESFLAKDVPLNLLINNAGIMMTPYTLTADGIESQFGTNHIGHYLLTNLLLDKLKETATKTGTESRIVNVSSRAISSATKELITWKSINDEKEYSSQKAYGRSKIANLFHAQQLTKRLQGEGVTNVTINSLHPGVIKTNLGRNTKWLLAAAYAVSFPFWKTVPQGAATSCYLALHPDVKGVSGKFFADSGEFDPTKYNSLAKDEQAAEQLWEVSAELTSK